MHLRLAIPLLRILSLLILLTTMAGAAQLTTIVASGEPAPDTGAGVTFAFVGYPTIDRLGDVAFYGTLQGPGIVASSNDTGLWLSTAAGLTLVARAGDPAPGTPTGVYFAWVSGPLFNDANILLFSGGLAGPGVTDQNNSGYLVTDGNGPPHLLYRDGDPVAYAGSSVALSGWVSMDQIGWSKAGLAFPGFLSGPTVTASNQDAVVATAPTGGLSVIARQGDQAPGTPSGVLFTGWAIPVQIADSGEVLFDGGVNGPGVTSGGLWLTDPTGSLSPLVLLGDPAPFPGYDPSVFFSTIGRRGFAADGSVFFMAGTDAPHGVAVDIEPSLWHAASDGTISLLLAGDTQAPGFSSGTILQQIEPAAAGPDTYVFSSTLYNSLGGGIGPNNNISYWLLRGGELTLLAQEGGTVNNIPGMPIFSFMEYDAPFPWTNSNGDLTLLGYLSGAGIVNGQGEAMLFASLDTGVISVLRDGDQLEVTPGDVRVVSYLNPGFSPLQSPLNDSRELVVPVQFQDGSTAIVVATVPKPTACGLLGIEVFAVLLPLAIWKRRGGRKP